MRSTSFTYPAIVDVKHMAIDSAERERYIAQRRAASQKRWSNKTPEARSEEARARWAVVEPNRRAAMAREAWAKRGQEARTQHRDAVKRALAKPEIKAKQKAASQRTWDSRNENERNRITTPMKAAAALIPSSRRSEIAKAGAAKTDPDRKSIGGRARWAKTTHEQRSQLAKNRWAARTPDERRLICEPAFSVAGLVRPSSIERIVASVLDALGVDYISQHVIGRRYVADFFVPSARLVIECDGTYWHSKPGARDRDARRDEYIASLGYAVLRLPETDIKSGAARLALMSVFGRKVS